MIEEKYDQVRRLINMGKERGYLLYDEVNDMLPAEVHSSEEIDDLLSTFECYGIYVYEDVSSAKAARAAAESAEISDTKPKEEVTAEEVELDLTSGTMEKTNDPVRIYLREMGTVPLLTREGAVAIAKRIERGQMLVLKTISRSSIMLKEILAIGEELASVLGRSRKVQFDDEELTDEDQNKTRQILRIIDKIRSSTKWRSSRPPARNTSNRRARLPVGCQCARADPHPDVAAGPLNRPTDGREADGQHPPPVERLHSSSARSSGSTALTPPRARPPAKRARSYARALGVERDQSRARSASPSSSALQQICGEAEAEQAKG